MMRASIALAAFAALVTAVPAEAHRDCRKGDRECAAARSAAAYRERTYRPVQSANDCRGRNDNECAARDPLGTLRDLAGRPIRPDGIHR